MTFGWQGFAFDHPDDWAPIQLTGTRDEGYVRIASATRLACQLRWRRAASDDGLADRLRAYLGKLERDAKKSKVAFDADLEADQSVFTYRYRGSNYGRGTLFFSADAGRIFFLELVSPKNESLLSLHRQLAGTFRCEDLDRWSLLGLDVRLPQGLKVERSVLQAGHIRLDLQAKGASIRAERWGFGEQLVDRHGLAGWARAALGLSRAKAEGSDERVRLLRGGIARTEAVVVRQAELNQLTAVIVRSRKPEWRPQWDWIV